MSKNIPTGFKFPTDIITLESQIVHGILVASLIYGGENIKEDDGVSRPVCTYFPFTDSTGTLRFGFRGSFRLSPLWPQAKFENKNFWEYIIEHDVISLPEGYYEEI